MSSIAKPITTYPTLVSVPNVPNKLVLLVKRLLLSLFTLFIARIVFIIANDSVFRFDSANELLWVLIGGLHFDFAVVLRTHFIFILLHLIPGKFKFSIIAERLSIIVFLLVNGILLAFNLLDAEYFDFTHKRSTIDLFFLATVGNDIQKMIPMFIGDHWYLICIWLGTMLMVFSLYPTEKRLVVAILNHKRELIIDYVIGIAIVFTLLFGARGKLNDKLVIQDAVQYVTKIENIPAVLNTPFSMLESIDKQELPEIKHGELQANNHSNYLNHQSLQKRTLKEKNVVVLILESFSVEYSQYLSGLEMGYMPFLDSLMQEGLHFTNAIANGKKSIEAVPSIMCGVPALMTNPVITSEYADNNFASLPDILGKYGYSSAFYHGAANGSMGFEQFCSHIGFEEYKGMSEYGEKSDYDGHWGIYDEPFLRFFANDLDSKKQPFMAGIFTLSSHHPYKIPEEYCDTFPEGSIAMLRTISYADYALREFFSEVKNRDWYKNTLFVITADHTGKPYTRQFSNSFQNYRIPMLFYAPGESELKGCDTTLTQQIDILPSILDYLGIVDYVQPFGNSVFTKTETFAINYLNGIYQFLQDEWLIQYDGKQPVGLYNWKQDKELAHNLLSQLPAIAGTMADKAEYHISEYIYRMSADALLPSEHNNSNEFYSLNEKY